MNQDAEIITVTGARGSGKTTRTTDIIANDPRVLSLDPMGGVRAFNPPGYRKVNSLHEAYQAIKEGWHTGFHLILRTPGTEAGCVPIMQQLSRDLFVIQKPYHDGKSDKKITLVLDEAHKYFPNRQMSPEDQEPLELIISQGRHYGIGMIANTQRLAKLWTEYRGNASQSYFFRQGDHTDYTAVLQIIGPQYREALRGLADHEYLHKGEGGLDITRGVNNWKRGKQ